MIPGWYNIHVNSRPHPALRRAPRAFPRHSSRPPRRHPSLSSLSPSTLNFELSTPISSPLRSIVSRNYPCNSHGIISFADHSTLNPIESYRSIKGGGGRGVHPSSQEPHSTPLFSGASLLDRGNSLCVYLFADPPTLNPYGSHFYKNIGGRGAMRERHLKN